MKKECFLCKKTVEINLKDYFNNSICLTKDQVINLRGVDFYSIIENCKKKYISRNVSKSVLNYLRGK